jgi:hypothetical protein
MSYLIYVNELGPNYKGDNIYEFIFSDSSEDVWGEAWESKPSNGYPLPPDIEHIKKVGVLKNDQITMSVIQNSDYFSMIDSMDDIIALCWEKKVKTLISHVKEDWCLSLEKQNNQSKINYTKEISYWNLKKQ